MIYMITEKHNKGRESGDKGTKKYGRWENGVREAGDCDPPTAARTCSRFSNGCKCVLMSIGFVS